VTATAEFEAVLASVEGVEGWLSDGQARVLWDRARELTPPGMIVEIGSYRGRSAIVLASAAAEGIEVVAIDPHAGNDRAPQDIHGTTSEGEADNLAFRENLERTGLAGAIRHVRRPSQDALGEVSGTVGLLYVDGAHRFAPAGADLVDWGARVAPGGTMIVHDAFSSVGVTLALARHLFLSRRWRYLGRERTLAQYRREALTAGERARNALRQIAELPWFARNLLVKAALVAHLKPVARLLGSSEWPY
jgi:Methyltransferase domain